MIVLFQENIQNQYKLVAAAEPRPLDGRAGVRTFRYMLQKSLEMVGCIVDAVVGHRDHAEVIELLDCFYAESKDLFCVGYRFWWYPS